MNTHQIGDVTVIRVPERSPWPSPILEFLPDLLQEDLDRHHNLLVPNHYDPQNKGMLLHFHTWVVKTPQHTILVDTCNGDHKQRPGLPMCDGLSTPYLDRMRAVGVEPDEVDFVMCTHLHMDHVGWNTRLVDGRWVPTFRNAKYLMSRVELEFTERESHNTARPQWERNVYGDSVLPVVSAGMAVVFDDGYEVDDWFSVQVAPGHSPGHCRANISSRGKAATFCGDMVHSPIQILMPWINTKVCYDKPQAAKSRHELLSFCVEHGALLLPMHFGAPHAAYIRSAQEGFVVDFELARDTAR
jgi:glyoxylase-like metal-dependent hydrolase (beta-lactamase superfamily II)